MGAVALYATLTLLQFLFAKKLKFLRKSPIALNILFLLFSSNIFLWDMLSAVHPDAVKWNIAALLFMAAYVVIRIVDYWVFDLFIKRSGKASIPVVLRDIFRWILATLALFIIVHTLFPAINLNVLAGSSIVVG
jgi:hypothetical protein